MTDCKGSTGVLRTAVPLLLAALLLLAGAFLLLWGDVSNACSRESFSDKLTLASQVEEYLRVGGNADEQVKRAAGVYESCKDYFVSYNQAVAAGEMPVNDPFEGHPAGEGLSYLESVDYLIGSISVPSMECELPLYFGAGNDNLANGAAVISGTSIPLGTGDSNCVIAGHRGWMSARYFRDIENVAPGDTLTLTLPWGVYRYQAVGSAVISPNEVDALAVVPGKDLVTLITCHPYGYNYQRYVVYFERADEATADSDEGEGFSFADGNQGSSLLKVENALRLVGVALAAVAAVLLVAGLIKAVRGLCARRRR